MNLNHSLYITLCVCVLILTVTVTGANSSQKDMPTYWRVIWYSVDPKSHVFTEPLGMDNWSTTNLDFNWGHQSLYDGKRDYVGFIAEATVYSTGDNYTFTVGVIEDKITVSLDGTDILQIDRNLGGNPGKVEMFVTKGTHHLQLTYVETCCSARLNFSTDILFHRPLQDDQGMFVFVAGAGILVAAIAIFMGGFRIWHRRFP